MRARLRAAVRAHFPPTRLFASDSTPQPSNAFAARPLPLITSPENVPSGQAHLPAARAAAASQSEKSPAGNTNPVETVWPAPGPAAGRSSRTPRAHPPDTHPNFPTAALPRFAEIATASPASPTAARPLHPETTFRPALHEFVPVATAPLP